LARTLHVSRADLFFLAVTTRSQLGQELVAAVVSGDTGFFVEFGAADGLLGSNTFKLETKFNWKGILAEPLTNWHDQLQRNRSCIIDTRAVWHRSNLSLTFEAQGLESKGHLAPRHRDSVTTVTLSDLLREHKAPKHINFLSIDTEGSEFTILENFDFNLYSFDFICIEHNYSEYTKKIDDLMNSAGYTKILEGFSDFDHWYVPTASRFANK
jgi:FkbM family methyltransferase